MGTGRLSLGRDAASFTLSLPVTPRGQERPRFANGHSYTPAKTRNAMREIREMWKAAGSPVVEAEWFSALVVARFQEPRTTKYPYPPRTDVDNIAKLVLDSLQDCAFPNDSRCQSLTVSKEWADADGLIVTLSWDRPAEG